ncbi:PaaI family thioesterase [Novosphingobium sp. BL-52-GroH]|uniref:PaaI family thioesterase n=1 Tax=Novosphingobium sp. BL-52-GroH TaxID=3349877 RepID=UPI00384DBE29
MNTPMQDDVPAGPPRDRDWLPLDNGGPFTDHVGDFHYAWESESRDVPPRFGFRVAPRHCNLLPTCHGGMLATFADVVMAKAVVLVDTDRTSLPTVNLSIDYLAPAPLGGWVEATVRIDRLATSLAFLHATFHVGETMVLRASGVFRIYRERTRAEGD